MATKKTKPRKPRAAPPAEPLEDDVLDLSEESIAEMELAEFMEVIGGSASFISVYRVGRAGDSDAFLENVPPDGFNEQTLRDNYGPGKYRLKFKGPNRLGRIVYKAHKTVVIGELRVGSTIPGHPAGAVAPNPAQDENKRLFELILALIAAGGNKSDVGAMMQGMASMMTAAASFNKGQSLPEVLTAVNQLRQASEPKDPIAHLGTTVELLNKLRGGDNGSKDEGWAGIVRDVLGAIVPQAPAQRQIAAGPAVPGVPGAAPPPQQPDTAAAVDEGENMGGTTEEWLRGQIEFLKVKALQGKPVQPWIDYTVDNADEAGCGAIVEAIRQGAQFAHLLLYFPDIAQNPPLRLWFETFYEGLRKRILNPAQPWGPGNVGNPGGDATPGATGPDVAGNSGATKFAF